MSCWHELALFRISRFKSPLISPRFLGWVGVKIGSETYLEPQQTMQSDAHLSQQTSSRLPHRRCVPYAPFHPNMGRLTSHTPQPVNTGGNVCGGGDHYKFTCNSRLRGDLSMPFSEKVAGLCTTTPENYSPNGYNDRAHERKLKSSRLLLGLFFPLILSPEKWKRSSSRTCEKSLGQKSVGE